MSVWLVFNKSKKKFIILNSKTLVIVSQGIFFYFQLVPFDVRPSQLICKTQ